MDLGNLVKRNARYNPDKLALIFEDQRFTFRQHNENINRLCNAFLDMGLKKGDKAATLLPNCVELLEIYWAAAKTGIVVVPLSTLLLGSGLKSLINDADEAAWDALKTINQRIVKRAVELDGTCTGEHGIGIGKREFMELEHGAGCELMKMIKDLIDPKGLMNPGKMFMC